MAQLVENLPVIQQTQVRSLDWEDPLEREWQCTPVFLQGEFLGQRSLTGYSPSGSKSQPQTGLNTHTHTHNRNTDIKNKLVDTAGEGEGGMN